MHPNEAHQQQGRGVCTPAAVRVILEEAEQGKIPVSGSGYSGPFDGFDYDGIWTDMSEILRPTRDGIHGRESISTQVALGRMLPDLCGLQFDDQGGLRSHIPPMREISTPIVFGLSPRDPGPGVFDSMALAATRLTTYATVEARNGAALKRATEYFNHLVVQLAANEVSHHEETLEWASIVELEGDEGCLDAVAQARQCNPHLLSIVRVPAAPGAEDQALRLADGGAETIHLYANDQGRGRDGAHLLDHLAGVHEHLVQRGLRDRVTLLASGGIVAAEHVPKAIIVGADAVAIDLPLLIALECSDCGSCAKGKACPRGLGEIDPRWGATRLINLVLSWRDQLLEVLGAMGLRDVRRLRGETGRAIFAHEARRTFDNRLAQGGASLVPYIEPGPAAEIPHGQTEPLPWRFSTPLPAYVVEVDRARCVACGLCVDSCQQQVHNRPEGRLTLEEPAHERCLGPDCQRNDWCCVTVCPWDAIQISPSPVSRVLGDRRWTPALLRSTWHQARTAQPPALTEAAQVGASGGGFDIIQFAEPDQEPAQVDAAEVDLSLRLNRRDEGPELALPLPVYGGGMSYGSISLQVIRGRAMAAQQVGGLTCTGEGGYPDELRPYSEHVITQIATGLFGVREETIQRAPMVEFKYAQGAKPGLGGHLLGEKNTPKVAAMRQAVPGTSLFSPFPFHSVYSVEDHKKHLDWIRVISPDTLISVKVSTAADVDMVAVGSYYAGANVVHLDGAYGGTGAAPDIAKKNIAQPLEYGTAQAHDFLVHEGIRDYVTLIVSGGIRTAVDALKAIALGADGVVIGTAELVAIDCVRCGNCERGRGCPIGIATTDALLCQQLTAEFVCQRIANLYTCWASTMRSFLARQGLSSVAALRGRRDLLSRLPHEEKQS
jgi:glutamate synthase domain-containing protein 2